MATSNWSSCRTPRIRWRLRSIVICSGTPCAAFSTCRRRRRSDLFGGKEFAQRRRGFSRRFIGQVVSGRNGLGGNDIIRVVAPDVRGARVVVASHTSGRTPQKKYGTFDPAAGRKIFCVHLQIDSGCGPVVLANRVDGCRIAEAAFVFGKRFGIEETETLLGFCELFFDEPVGIGAHHPLGQVEWLDIEEPVPGERRPLLVDVVVQVMLWYCVAVR